MTGGALDQVVQLVTADFGLVADLAWNTAMQGLFGEAGGLFAEFAYAVVTVVVVLITGRLGRLAERIKKDGNEGGADAP